MSNLDRILIVGGSCTGKTTLATQIAKKMSIPRIELDELHWEPNWQEKPRDEFRANVQQAVAQPRWVCDGMYTFLKDLTWTRATTLVWLDYSFPLVIQRAIRRTAKRILLRETLYNGNRETFTKTFFNRDSILLWVLTSHRGRHQQIRNLIAMPEHAHLNVVQCQKPVEAARFLENITPNQ